MAADPDIEADDPGTAGAVARPPLLVLGALVFGFGLDHLLPLPRLLPAAGVLHDTGAIVGGALFLAGVAIFAASIRGFVRAGTPVQGTRPTLKLVTTGLFAWSRNPIYLAMVLFLVGIGLLVRSPWILLLIVLVALIIRYGVIAREEAYLERCFGDDYRSYKARVRRWF